MKVYQKLFLGLLLLTNLKSIAQEIALDSCQIWARENYPTVKQLAILKQSEQFSMANIEKGLWPQISLNGQATLQSDVTQIPLKIPGINIPSLSKDQYKAYADINQPITDFWIIEKQKKIIQNQFEIEKNKYEVDLYQIKQKINQIFLGIILLQAQQDLLNISITDLDKSITKIESGIKNGVSFGLQRNLLLAEKIKIEQRSVELKSAQKQYIAMLELFIGKKLSDSTIFKIPVFKGNINAVNRPELILFQSQSQLLSNQSDFIETKKLPKASLFLQSGYGRPTLNMLNNQFGFYGIGGLRIQWNITSWYTIQKEQELLNNSQKNIKIAEENFQFQNKLSEIQGREEVNKFDQLIASDQKAIILRQEIRKSLEVQWEQGLLSTQDYLIQLSAEEQVKQNEIVHQIQKLLALAQIQFIQGQQ